MRRGGKIRRDALIAWLERNGYRRSGTVVEQGEYAVRGGLLDLFPTGATTPSRLDLFGDVVDSWVNRGSNQDISSRQVSDALGSDVVDQLSRRTGLSRDQVIDELAKILPSVVDRMTPDGRLPTQREFQRLVG